MKRGARLALRALGACALALVALELLLPFALVARLDAERPDTARARAFHRALLRPDLATIERLRTSAFLAQDESAAQSLGAPDPTSVGIEIRTNAHGLRMREIEIAPLAGVLRIAVLGDSVSFGWRVREAECWPRVLERVLRESGLAVEVLNFAVPGYTTAQAVAQLRARALAFTPHLVLVATGFNDHWLRPGPGDRERLQRAESTSAMAHLLHAWRRESAVLRATRRWIGEAEPGTPAPGAPLDRRLPRADLEAELLEALVLCRAARAKLVLLDLCLPHARTSDALHAFAARNQVAVFDGRASFGWTRHETLALAAPRRLRAAVEPGLRARWDEGRDELLALAFPPDRVRGLADLELRALRRDGAHAWLELEAGASRDWAIVPRSYLAASPSLERLMTLVYHRVGDGPPEGEIPVGRFLGAAYDAADAPYAELAHGEAIHPNAAGHERIAADCARFLRERPELLGAGARGSGSAGP